MSYINTLWIRYFYKLVGVDEYGNEYFVSNRITSTGRKKRYVLYKGIKDGSKVPAVWHAWLHYSIDDISLEETFKKYKWQTRHIQNLTGSSRGDMPSNFNSVAPQSTATYSRWKPLGDDAID